MGGPATHPQDGGWWRRGWPWAAAVLAIALAIVVTVFLTRSDEAGAEVILQPTASAGGDPFTESVATKEVEVEGGSVEQIAGGSPATESIAGSSPELYGGTGDQAVCDGDALVTFLRDNPDKGRAFAVVLGVKPKDLGDYVAELTPLVLREDTRVTNHGFSGGRATPYQAVLQAGTAVMVDDRGVPRVRCACGNPLSEPDAVSSAPEYSGERWEGFDDERLVAVSPAEGRVDSFEVVDVETGKTYEQSSGATGPAEEIVMKADGFPERIGDWKLTPEQLTVPDAEKAFGPGHETTQELTGTCVTTWPDPAAQTFTPTFATGAAGRCIPEGQAIFDVRIESDGFETEDGLRPGMPEGEVERLYPDATKDGRIPQETRERDPGEILYTLVTAESPFGGNPVSTLSAAVKDGRVVALEVKTPAFIGAE